MIFEGANDRLMSYVSLHGNQAEVDNARAYLRDVVNAEFQPNMLEECAD